jgi:hypothetical protein
MGIGVDLAVLRGQVLILKVENERLRAIIRETLPFLDGIQNTTDVEVFREAGALLDKIKAALANQQPPDEPLNMIAKQKEPYPYQHRCLRLARAVLLANRGLLDRDPASIEIKMADEDSLAAAIEASVTTWLNQQPTDEAWIECSKCGVRAVRVKKSELFEWLCTKCQPD